MCGIAGLFSTQINPALAQTAARMTQVLYHRGPDDGGLVTFDDAGNATAARLGKPDEPFSMAPAPARVALGTRRLSIIDLSPRGHQPMCSSDGHLWIAYNGEIYNHVELRDQLRAAGRQFQTNTDTEVVLAAWQAWGMPCLERFDGMWAFALYEPQRRELVLSRDRFGIKPLYYTQTPTGLAFASEIKALLAIPDTHIRVNNARLADFLSQDLLDHTQETLFEGIFAIPAGCNAIISLPDSQAPSATLIPWFTLPPNPLDPPPPHRPIGGISATVTDWKNGPARLRFALEESVRLHLRSDVPVGSCLSGGIDSSSIVASLAALRQPRTDPSPVWSQHAFTASLPGDPLDESTFARSAVAEWSDIRSHVVSPTAAGLLGDLDRLLYHQDEPFGSPSIYLQWEVMKAARLAGVPVLLDGQGADELFCGYPGYLPPFLAQRMRNGSLGEFWRIWRSPFLRQHYRKPSLAYHITAQLLSPRIRDAIRRTRGSFLTAELLHEARRRATPPIAPNSPSEDVVSLTPFAAFWQQHLRHTSLPSLLHFEDRNSMAFSIEARVPFLGNAVSEFAIACPASLKLGGGFTKAILRSAMRGRVPDTILDRRDKIGFAAPTHQWMMGPLREWWLSLLSSQACRSRGWVRPGSVQRLARRIDDGCANSALSLWRAALAEQWATLHF